MRLPELKMNTLQIKNILSHDRVTKQYFLGVFSSDQLPAMVMSYPACFVCNTDRSTEPGSHWIAFYIISPNEVEFFDSFGNEPAAFQGPILNFASRYSRVTYNPMQSNVTAVCGQYCIYYLYSKCKGQSLNFFLSFFVFKNMCNDYRVYNFVAKRYGVYVNFYQ